MHDTTRVTSSFAVADTSHGNSLARADWFVIVNDWLKVRSCRFHALAGIVDRAGGSHHEVRWSGGQCDGHLNISVVHTPFFLIPSTLVSCGLWHPCTV